MDEFLREIHVQFFKKWICLQTNEKYTIDDHQEDIIFIETEYGLGEITFNPMNIIELKVTNKLTDDIDFYLHFQMKTMKHAVELFYEMIKSIMDLSHKPVTKVLLSCSGGLTTSFFANRISEVIQLLGLNMEVDAVGYNQLFQVGDQYDVILLAPQISYLHAKVQEILKRQIVLNIPPQVFAKYDVGKIISLINEEKQNKIQDDNIQLKPLSLEVGVEQQNKILCLSIFKNKERIHINYRLYQKSQILLNKEVMKYSISIQDIYDVIDTVILHYPDISVIGMSIPGIIYNGLLSSSYIYDIENNEIEKAFTKRYHQKIVITNDVNAAAVGYYVSQKKYQTFMFIFEPVALGIGSGIIINGQLICGAHNFAGEVIYLPFHDQKDHQPNVTPESAMDIVSKTVISAMCVIDPQAIILFCDLITDIDELKKEIEKRVPQEFIPDMIKVDHMLEYILLGQMVLCSKL